MTQITAKNKFDRVRCRHKKKNLIKYMPLHITVKKFFTDDWVVEDTGVKEELVLQNVNDLTALRAKVTADGMETTNETTKDEMIAFMNEPEKAEAPEKPKKATKAKKPAKSKAKKK